MLIYQRLDSCRHGVELSPRNESALSCAPPVHGKDTSGGQGVWMAIGWEGDRLRGPEFGAAGSMPPGIPIGRETFGSVGTCGSGLEDAFGSPAAARFCRSAITGARGCGNRGRCE